MRLGTALRMCYQTNKTTLITEPSLQETHTLSATASYPTNVNENLKDGGNLVLRIWILHVVCTCVRYVCIYTYVCMYARMRVCMYVHVFLFFKK